MQKIAKKTKNTLLENILLGKRTLYAKVLIIRGIGYRAYKTSSDFFTKIILSDCQNFVEFILREKKDLNMNWKYIITNEFKFSQYLIIRAGHTLELTQPIPCGIFVKILKKDRKMIIYGASKKGVGDFHRFLYDYRSPSVYTGRGIRRKYFKPLNKVGKKDKQKGKSF